MIAERIKEIRRAYRRDMDDVEAMLTNELCNTYKEITGKKASLKFEEAIAEALRCEGI